jgi:hypothetical protein
MGAQWLGSGSTKGRAAILTTVSRNAPLVVASEFLDCRVLASEAGRGLLLDFLAEKPHNTVEVRVRVNPALGFKPGPG